ncbi:MAG: MFS transporter [Chloroflexi bacterium HGW-Chloroflexi-3]|nr:MAG: MFS transporter [Chloroflexi bacterium HGW-Chloroflexi-3]
MFLKTYDGLLSLATSMETLILFRAIQGLGAGGVLPLALTMIGELYSIEKRAKMQGLISSVWGLSSVIGPLIGGLLVDQISWEWVFFINLIPGILAIIFVWFAWIEDKNISKKKVALDVPGVVLLTVGVLSLLLGLNGLENSSSLFFIITAIILLSVLIIIEKRAQDPILPLKLFGNRLFLVAFLHGILAGWAMFGSLSYIPLFVQAVIGTSATQAGLSLTPMSIMWTLTSIVGGRLIIKINFRVLAIIGMVLLVIGSLLLTTIGLGTSQLALMIYTSIMGIGMGLTIPVFMIIIQTTVPRNVLGTATSTIQFSRNIGGTIGVSVLGVFLSSRLSRLLIESGFNISTISLSSLINQTQGTDATFSEPLRIALSTSMANMFYIALGAAVLGFIVILFTPKGVITQLNSSLSEKKLEIVKTKELSS